MWCLLSTNGRFYFGNNTNLGIQFAGLFFTPTLCWLYSNCVIMTAKIIKVERKVCGVFIPLTERFYFRNNANLAV